MAEANVSTEKFDLSAAVRTAISRELYDVIKVLRFGTKLGAIKPFGRGKPSHHFAFYRVAAGDDATDAAERCASQPPVTPPAIFRTCAT